MKSTKAKMLEQCKIMIKEHYGFLPKSVMSFKKVPEYEELIGDKNCALRNLGNIGKARRRGGGDASKINYSLSIS